MQSHLYFLARSKIGITVTNPKVPIPRLPWLPLFWNVELLNDRIKRIITLIERRCFW